MYGSMLKLILYGVTLKECFGPKVSYGEPEDGYFVQFVDYAPVEGEDGGQVVQLPVEPLSNHPQ